MPLLTTRRRALATAAALAAVLPATVIASPSQADDASTVTVVGTSDVYDSNLVQAVLKPGFEKAYPQYKIKYVSKGTGAAIAFAKEGTASAMIVHAAALENQFVDEGYSLEKYGRAIFWGDYILAGAVSDPAGIKPAEGFSHDIVGDYEKIAAKGLTGGASFVSRGGTPGTTVQEHAIWALTGDINGDAPGSGKCVLSANNGGGQSPSTNSTDADPTPACPATIPYPTWYSATGLTQGPNVVAANVCNFPAPAKDQKNCYVFTDRGTFNYLQEQDDTYPSVQGATKLKVVTFQNQATPTVPTGDTLLINSFHAYVLNPAKFTSPNVKINTAGATAFLDWMTSPEGQKAVSGHLKDFGAPFVPSASPATTASAVPARIKAGQSITVKGNLRNVTPGTPALAGVTVNLTASPLSSLTSPAKVVASGVTDATGSYSITYKPRSSGFHSIQVPTFTKVEDDDLSPVFGDVLTGVTRPVGLVQVQSAVSISSVTTKGRYVRIKGTLSPSATGSKGYISLYSSVTKHHKKKSLKYTGRKALKNGASRFDVRFKLPKGQSRVRVAYVDKGNVVTSYSTIRNARIR